MSHDTLVLELARYNSIRGLLDLFVRGVQRVSSISAGKVREMAAKWCWQYLDADPVIPDVEGMEFDTIVRDINYIVHNEVVTPDKLVPLMARIKRFTRLEHAKLRRLRAHAPPAEAVAVTSKQRRGGVTIEAHYASGRYGVVIPVATYDRLVAKLPEDLKKEPSTTILALYLRYSQLDSGNQQLAIHPSIKALFKERGVNSELFGSALNSYSDSYCSLFEDVERHFGSRGSFFAYDIPPGAHWCNPPFDDGIMTEAGEKLAACLEKPAPYCFLVTIPIWDDCTQKRLALLPPKVRVNFNADTPPFFHDDHAIYETLKPWNKMELVLPKTVVPYFNYRRNRFIYAVDCYLMLVCNSTYEKSCAKELHRFMEAMLQVPAMFPPPGGNP